MLFHQRRDIIANSGALCGRLARKGLDSALAGLLLAGLLLVGLVAIPAAAAEITWVETETTDVVVRVDTASDFDPTTTLKLRLRTQAGALVDSRPFSAGAGTINHVLLDGQFSDLGSRGWQHRVELEENGTVVDSLDVRFALDCSSTPCEVVARPGVSIDGAVAMAPELAPHLASGAPVDFAQLAVTDSALAGALYETGVEWTQRAMGGRCVCLFLASVTGGGQVISAIAPFWDESSQEFELWDFYMPILQSPGLLRAGHQNSKTATVRFTCFRTTALSVETVTTSWGSIVLTLPHLAPCSKSCSPQVEWRATEMDWSVHLDNTIDLVASAAYDLSWSVDGLEVGQEGGYWQRHAAVYLDPLSLSGTWTQPPPPVLTTQLPSTAQAGGWSWVEAAQMSGADHPRLQVSAGYDFEANAASTCSPPATVRAQATIFGEGATPANLPVILGPDEEVPP